MKYRNVVIRCKKKDAEAVQKYLFRLKYHWIDNGKKHRHVKDFTNIPYIKNQDYIYFVIKNDTSFHYTGFDPRTQGDGHHRYTKVEFQLLDYPKFIRKEKLKKLNNV